MSATMNFSSGDLKNFDLQYSTFCCDTFFLALSNLARSGPVQQKLISLIFENETVTTLETLRVCRYSDQANDFLEISISSVSRCVLDLIKWWYVAD